MEFLLRLSTSLFFIFVLSIPVWIRAISIRQWQPSTKKFLITVMLIISLGFSIYGFSRPHASSSLNWIGQASLGLYFIAGVISAYFNWPRPQQESEIMISGSSKRKSSRKKNKVYVSVPLMAGTDGNATVAILNATFQKVNESKKRYPDPDFGAWLIEQIYDKKKIRAERQGVFKKKYFCPSCGTELASEIREPKHIEYEFTYKDFDPFIVQITIPAATCPKCNRVCGMDLDGSLTYHLNEAIIAAFNSENIKP